jgi:hypothetical protein
MAIQYPRNCNFAMSENLYYVYVYIDQRNNEEF